MAMGMSGRSGQRWAEINNRYIAATASLSDVAGSYGSASKVIRLLLQSVDPRAGRLSRDPPGAECRRDVRRLDHDGARAGADRCRHRQLARPHRRPPIAVAASRTPYARRGEAATPLCRGPRAPWMSKTSPSPRPGDETTILANVRFSLEAGQAVGIIGPSGAGKSSLVRTLIGVWPPASGGVRLDAAALDQWDDESLGRHIGYVGRTSNFSKAPSRKTSPG